MRLGSTKPPSYVGYKTVKKLDAVIRRRIIKSEIDQLLHAHITHPAQTYTEESLDLDCIDTCEDVPNGVS